MEDLKREPQRISGLITVKLTYSRVRSPGAGKLVTGALMDSIADPTRRRCVLPPVMLVQEIHESRISCPFSDTIYTMIQSVHHRPPDGTTNLSANTGTPGAIALMLGPGMPPDFISVKRETGPSFGQSPLGRRRDIHRCARLPYFEASLPQIYKPVKSKALHNVLAVQTSTEHNLHGFRYSNRPRKVQVVPFSGKTRLMQGVRADVQVILRGW